MYLAIGVSVIVLVIFIILATKPDVSPLIGVVVGIFCAVFVGTMLNFIELDTPRYAQAHYYTSIGNDKVLFTDYQINSEQLIIPAHYYLKHDWLNSWVYCEESLIIRCSDNAQSHVWPRPADAPYIEHGTIECEKGD
jgi:hypothetical protein